MFDYNINITCRYLPERTELPGCASVNRIVRMYINQIILQEYCFKSNMAIPI